MSNIVFLYVSIFFLIKIFKNLLFDGIFNISGYLGFLGVSDSKESACNAEDLGLIPDLGRCPGGGHDNPFQYSCLENPHGQRSLAGCKELDTTGRLSTAQHIRKQINLKRDVKERCVCVCVYVCVCVCVCV